MGLFDAVKGALDSSGNFEKEVNSLLIEGETLEGVMRLVEDYIALTSKRVILVDRKSIGSSRSVLSIPYSKITEVAVTSGGFMKFSQDFMIQVGNHKHDFKVYNPEQTGELYKVLVRKIT